MSEENENQKNNLKTAENESFVTMLDILEEEKELEEESSAVLGGSDEKCCTYFQGYIKRQALYSCLTCCPESKNDLEKSAGICLACSYNCHENHELIELYTKRNFRCDCPTVRINGKQCSFVTSSTACRAESLTGETSKKKFSENEHNVYNQNFSGVYCTCHRPYPDSAADAIQDEMIQCIGCEDWYHSSHLNIDYTIPKSTEYEEMVCEKCMEKFSFLKDYVGLAVHKVSAKETKDNLDESREEAQIENENIEEKPKTVSKENELDVNSLSNEDIAAENEKHKVDDETLINDSKDDFGEPSRKKIKIDLEKICKRPTLVSNYKKGAIFWPGNWRKLICSCEKCYNLYNELKIGFLLDPEDTVHFYEENGSKKSKETNYERGIKALSSIGHTQQIDAITEYNRMKEKLKDFLKTFVESKQVVTEEDINNFFQGMKNEKKNLPKSGEQSHFCR